jgi:hypothetical protein
MKAYSWAYDHGRDLLYFAVENHICEPDFQLWGALYHLGEIRDGRRDPRTGPRLVSFFEMYGRAPTKKSASYLDQIERAAMHELYLAFGNLLCDPTCQEGNIMLYLEQFARARAAMPPYFKSLSTSKQKKLVNEFYVRDSATHERDPEVASCRN